MSRVPVTRARRSLRMPVAYGLAIVLPVLSTVITKRVEALHPFPQALHFLSMVMIASLGGFGPALLCVLISVVIRMVQIGGVPAPEPALIHSEIIRSAILLAGAVIISAMSRGRRASEARLELAHAQLQERTDALVQSLASSKCASWIFDLDGGSNLSWYHSSYPVFGRPFTEIEQLPSVLPLLHPDDRVRLAVVLSGMETSRTPVLTEFRVLWPNGELHWLEMRGTRTPGLGCRWRGVTLDITERKLAEAALLHSEKLAAMGRLASTVAHEINNPLEAVTNLLYLAVADDGIPEETRGYLETAEKELARLGNITRLTLGFVRVSGSTSRVDLGGAIDHILTMLHHRFESKKITVKREYAPGVFIFITPHELRQIITNLITNAADAVYGPEATISVRIERTASAAILCVEDNGSGISAANLPRIFEPFYTTKDEVGTGIGLWVTRELVEKNGGRISLESLDSGSLPAGVATRFRVEFPLAPEV